MRRKATQGTQTSAEVKRTIDAIGNGGKGTMRPKGKIPGVPVTVRGHTFTPYDYIDDHAGQCELCSSFAEAWVAAKKRASPTHFKAAVEWARRMHDEFHCTVPRQLYLLEQAYTFIPWDPPVIHQLVSLRNKEACARVVKEYNLLKQSKKQLPRHIWFSTLRRQGKYASR